MKSAIVHYQEIALKGRNRPWFISRLVRNIREATSDLDIRQVKALMGRIEVVLGPSSAIGCRKSLARETSPRLDGRRSTSMRLPARSCETSMYRIRDRFVCRRAVPTNAFR